MLYLCCFQILIYEQQNHAALIVQGDNLQTGLSQVVVAMITSKLFRANHATRVVIYLNTPESQHSGLLSDSVVMTDNLATIYENAIERVIGKLSINEIDKALRYTLNL